MVASRVRIDHDALRRFLLATNGPAALAVQAATQVALQGAKRRAPVSPAGSGGNRSGYLRSSLRGTVSRRGDDTPVGRVEAHADYALFVEVGTRPHDIESKGPWPLRNPRTGQVFGHRVHHPGTAAQPYLRPCLDDLAGRRF